MLTFLIGDSIIFWLTDKESKFCYRNMPFGKIKNNGNFMVSFHKVLVDVLLIINVVCFIFRVKRGTACHVLNWRSWENLYDRYGYSSPRYGVRATMLSLSYFEISQVSSLQDKHNASSNSKMSWRESFLSSNAKIWKNAGSAITFPAFFILVHKYL